MIMFYFLKGDWNNTIGYESKTGKCLSSHRINANTLGRPVLKNDKFGLFISNFGSYQSTVLFIHNNEPVATRQAFLYKYTILCFNNFFLEFQIKI